MQQAHLPLRGSRRHGGEGYCAEPHRPVLRGLRAGLRHGLRHCAAHHAGGAGGGVGGRGGGGARVVVMALTRPVSMLGVWGRVASTCVYTHSQSPRARIHMHARIHTHTHARTHVCLPVLREHYHIGHCHHPDCTNPLSPDAHQSRTASKGAPKSPPPPSLPFSPSPSPTPSSPSLP